MQWNPSYSVGVASMDEQHKTWIALLNELDEAMKQGKGQDKLGALFGKITEYIGTHLASEEDLCAQHAYPDTQLHKVIHARYAQSVRRLHEEFKSGKTLMSIKVMDAMRAWLVEHIMKEDKKYGVFMNNKGVR